MTVYFPLLPFSFAKAEVGAFVTGMARPLLLAGRILEAEGEPGNRAAAEDIKLLLVPALLLPARRLERMEDASMLGEACA